MGDCATTSDWYTLWFSETQVLTRYECFLSNIMLSIDEQGELLDPKGVEVRGRDYGGMDGVNYANAGSPDPIPVPYLIKFTNALTKIGYTVGKSLRAATYDFRRAGQDTETKAMFARLQQLVEETYALQGNNPVHLVGHSLGCNFANSFLLHQVSSEWKAKYIASLVILSPPLAGTPVAIQGTIAGPVFPYVSQQIPALVAPAVRTMASIGWMFPHEDETLWPRNLTFIETKKRNYTIADIPDIVAEMNSTVLTKLWPSLKVRHHDGFMPPEVPVLALYANDS